MDSVFPHVLHFFDPAAVHVAAVVDHPAESWVALLTVALHLLHTFQ